MERDLAKVEAAGSSPVSRFFYFLKIKSRTLFRKCPTDVYKRQEDTQLQKAVEAVKEIEK